jgi:hypothetical protein
MDVSGQLQVQAALPPKKEPPVSIGLEARWAAQSVSRLWRREKSLALAGNRTPAVQPLARLYSD